MNSDFMNLSRNLRNESLLKTESLFVAQKTEWLALFAENFLSVCTEIVRQQRESSLPPISRMEYIMLNTNFINRRYIAEVWVFGKDRYIDKKQRMVGEYDVSFLFVYFDEMWGKLLSSRKRYLGNVKAREVTSFILESFSDFYSYLISIARFAIVECVDNKPFIDIAKDELFKINVGDYMAETETVYEENKNKNADDLTKWFNERLSYKYNYGDYSGLDFSGKEFMNTDFRYAMFRRAVLNRVNFNNSSLIGANFRFAEMEGCQLDNCFMFEADFSNANMKNASFKKATAKVGLIDENEWSFVGFLPASFRNADLTSANFTQSKLTGADFTGAILSNADFTGAILTGADFTKANLSNANFTVAISSGANFTDANLTGVDFTSAVLLDADFTNAILDDAIFDGCIRVKL